MFLIKDIAGESYEYLKVKEDIEKLTLWKPQLSTPYLYIPTTKRISYQNLSQVLCFVLTQEDLLNGKMDNSTSKGNQISKPDTIHLKMSVHKQKVL